MKKRNLVLVIYRLSKSALAVLPLFFIAFLIFGFNERRIALITLSAALIHEAGHLCCIAYSKKSKANIRSIINGFKIRPQVGLSYDDMIKVYISGPLTNILAFVLCAMLSCLLGEFWIICSLINLATALSNLLPIDGYDGYGIIKSVIEKREAGYMHLRILRYISSSLILIFCIFSLYLIDRIGEGFWIFAIFFISLVKCLKFDFEE